MQAWRQHWNHQLYKALEHQYQTGLEALNKNLPEIHIDLTFRSVHTLPSAKLSVSLFVSLNSLEQFLRGPLSLSLPLTCTVFSCPT